MARVPPEIAIEIMDPFHDRRKLWPLRPSILEDELLSGWLWRIANLYNIPPRDFQSMIPFGTLGTEIDCRMPTAGLASLACASGKCWNDLLEAMLCPPDGHLIHRDTARVHAGLTRYGNLLLRRRDGRDQHDVLQFCPKCLAEDKVPFFRKDWRFAHVVSCPVHAISLHDRCPGCTTTLVILSAKAVFRYPACQACGFDLRLASSRRMESSRHRLQVRLCALLDFLINRGARVAEIRAMLSAIRHLPRKSAFLAEDVGLNDLSLEQRFSLFNHLTPETLVDLMIGPGTRPQDRWHRHILRTGSLDDLPEAERDPRRSHPGPATPRRRP